MSNLYNLEPQPTAKVVLQTTSGDISLELFAKQTPLASRNFLQHCLDGYYDNTVFHRLVPGFIIQGGDPTGTGSGGISALDDGEPFQDEFHSRLKFNRRGLVGMANEGNGSNTSQFFFTLAATPELQGKNTMFGRVEGDTIYNLMKMADAELVEGEGSERPLYPTKITGAEVLVNPFEGMIARAREAPRSEAKSTSTRKEIKKRKKPLGRNILSFGDEGEGDIAPLTKKAKVNPKFVLAADPEALEKQKPAVPSHRPQVKTSQQQQNGEIEKPLPELEEKIPAKMLPSSHKIDVLDDDDDEDVEMTIDQPQSRQAVLERTNAEIAALKRSMKRTADSEPRAQEKPVSALEAMIPANSSRGRKRGGKAMVDESGDFDLFATFRQRLQDLPEPPEPSASVINQDKPGGERATANTNGENQNGTANADAIDEDEAKLCDLHFIPNCQSCKSWDVEGPENDQDNDDSVDWMTSKLSFAKDSLGKDLEWKRKMQEIEVIDPREKTREILGDRRKGHKEKTKPR